MDTRGCAALSAALLAVVMTSCRDESTTAKSAARCTPAGKNRQGAITLTATLMGAAVVRTDPAGDINAEGVPNQGDVDGTGCATVELDVTKGELCYKVFVQRIDPVESIYIQAGKAGTNGHVVTSLYNEIDRARLPQVHRVVTPVPAAGATFTGCQGSDSCPRTPCLADVIPRMAENPENYYLQVRTPSAMGFNEGALRGQLSR